MEEHSPLQPLTLSPALELEKNKLFNGGYRPDLSEALSAGFFVDADGHDGLFPRRGPSHAHEADVHILLAEDAPHAADHPGLIDLPAQYDASFQAHIYLKGAYFGQARNPILHSPLDGDLPGLRDRAREFRLDVGDLNLNGIQWFLRRAIEHYPLFCDPKTSLFGREISID